MCKSLALTFQMDRVEYRLPSVHGFHRSVVLISSLPLVHAIYSMLGNVPVRVAAFE